MSDNDSFVRHLARAAQPGPTPADACVDPERLAAFMDGRLSDAERVAVESHLADCGRCLELTAAMVRSEPPAAVPLPRRSWWSTGWLVPTTAAGVALLAWVVIREPHLPMPPIVSDTASSSVPESAAPVLPSETSKAPVPEFRQERARADSGAQAKTQPATKQLERAAAQAAPPAAAVEQRREADAAASNAAASRIAPVPPLPAAAPPDTQITAFQSRDALAPVASRVIASPDPSVLWRVAGAAVERTSDGGRTWQAQTIPPGLEIRAGAAPSPTTVWLVGRAGVVLLTADGQQWQRLTFPDATADLVAVTAVDALSATVTTSEGRRYRTTDGGRTWAVQDPLAPPF